MLTVEQVKNTKIIPCAVYGGKVHSFKMEGHERLFDGELLKVGLDGRVYVVFKDDMEAEMFQDAFDGCYIACFGQYDNAYEVSK